jgi:xanthine dehydrogenase accessory factor
VPFALWFNKLMSKFILLRGGGDLASGVAFRLHRAGLNVVITELPQPLAVRRLVSFSEAVYDGQIVVEGITASRVGSLDQALDVLSRNEIPVLIDPKAEILHQDPSLFRVLIDARLIKNPPDLGIEAAQLVIGLGPGFVAGENCHAVIETNRGHFLGRVYWQGTTESDTRQPEGDPRRVLRAPSDGLVIAHANIGDHIQAGQAIFEINGQVIKAPFTGALRGLIHPGLEVIEGMKIGDLDARDDSRYARQISDKSLAIGGAVLEAILGRPELRSTLWD